MKFPFFVDQKWCNVDNFKFQSEMCMQFIRDTY